MATILPVVRSSIGPVPPLQDKGIALTLEKWLPQLPTRLILQRLDTQLSTTAATATSTPILVLPSSRGLWLVTVGIGPVGDAVNYQAMMFVFVDGTSSRALLVQNAPNQTISLSGLTVSTTQSSGAPQHLVATALQLTNF